MDDLMFSYVHQVSDPLLCLNFFRDFFGRCEIFFGKAIGSITLNDLFISSPFFINHSILSSIISGCKGSFLVLLMKATVLMESALCFLFGISLIALVIRLSILFDDK